MYALRGVLSDVGNVYGSVVEGEMMEAYIVKFECTGAGPDASRFSTTPSESTGATTLHHLPFFSSSEKCLQVSQL